MFDENEVGECLNCGLSLEFEYNDPAEDFCDACLDARQQNELDNDLDWLELGGEA